MSSKLNTTLTDREGISVVERIVTRDLRWYFREQAIVDQGIDAHVEVADSGHGTGRLIALQIKSGPSWFRRPAAGGWTFYYTHRERTLWHRHVLPVVVVLVDLQSDTAYWQRIEPEVERQTKKGWAITVPETQTVSTAAQSWELFSSGMEDLARERYTAHLAALPPQVVDTLESRGAGGRQAQLIALHLASGRQDPGSAAQTLLSAPPIWMESDDGWPWAALANYCAQHGELLQSADALEIAAASNPGRAGERLGIAALHAVQDPSRARDLIERANRLGGGEVPVAIAEAILNQPADTVRPAQVDGVIAAAGSALNDDALVQLFLAEQAARSRELDDAARYGQRALELAPDDSEAMTSLARICLQRSITPNAHADDLERAIRLFGNAVTQRRRWAGSTRRPLADLARALIVQGSPEEALRWLVSPPHGTAEEVEAEDPELLRLALAAAKSAKSDLTHALLERVGDDQRDRATLIRLGILHLPDTELEALWAAELDRAQSTHDYTGMTDAVLRLALLGIDASDRLTPLIAASILPAGAEQFPSAIAELRHDPEEALRRLRALATSDLAAADHLVSALIERGRRKDAIEACQLTFERFREPRFLTQRALLIAEEGPPSRAEAALHDALDVEKVPSERLRLATRLAAMEADDGRWSNAEARLSKEVGGLEPPPEDAVWNLVRVQIGAAAENRAVATLARYRPNVRDHEEAGIWLTAMRTVPWDASAASEAIALAARFDDNPKLAVALLSHVILSTRGMDDEGSPSHDEDSGDPETATDPAPVDDRPAVPGDLHRQAFQALDALVKTHGEETGVKVITTDPDNPLGQLEELLQAGSRPDLGELLDAVAIGTLPAGMLAIALGRPYALVLAKRAAGQLFAIATDDDEYDSELEAVRKAVEGPVVVDLSTLLVLTQLTDREQAIGHFTTLLLSKDSRDDLLRTVIDVQGLAASTGSLDWDPVTKRPVFIPHTDEQYQDLRARINAIDALAHRTSVRSQRRPILGQKVPPEVASSPWLSAIEIAAHEEVALWCDDIAVRRFARSVGVATFSTMAVIEFVSDQRLAAASSGAAVEAEIALRGRVAAQMLAERIVDVPIGPEQLIEQASSDRWVALGPAAVALSRPAWWTGQTKSVEVLLRIYDAAGQEDSSQLRHWQYVAMLGAGRGLVPEAAESFLAFLALLGWGTTDLADPQFDNLVAGCQNAQLAAKTLGIGDPMLALPTARASLVEAGAIRPEALVRALIAAIGPTQSPSEGGSTLD